MSNDGTQWDPPPWGDNPPGSSPPPQPAPQGGTRPILGGEEPQDASPPYASPAPPPGYGPGSYAQGAPGHAPPGQRTAFGGGGTGGRGRGPVVLLALLGGLVALGVLAGAFFLLRSDDGESTASGSAGTEETQLAPSGEEGEAEEDVAAPSAEDRIGTTVGLDELLAGDCINFDPEDNSGAYTIADCNQPHLAEIVSQVPHPDAGADYPGPGEFLAFSAETCPNAVAVFTGAADLLDTTFAADGLSPGPDEWESGFHDVSCLASQADGTNLIESVESQAGAYGRGTNHSWTRLKPGECFLPADGTAAFEDGVDEVIVRVDCATTFQGRFFAQIELDHSLDDPYPGEDAVATETIEICDGEYQQVFGVPGGNRPYSYWAPVAEEWEEGNRTAYCFVAYERLQDLPLESCFLMQPGAKRDDLTTTDWVLDTSCNLEHNGQLFGLGELDGDRGFPGDATVEAEVVEQCRALYVDLYGPNSDGSYTYWVPTQSGWGRGVFTWACAVVTDELRTGSPSATT